MATPDISRLKIERGDAAAALLQRGIRFCIRIEQSCNGGVPCVNQFLRFGLDEQTVTLRAMEPPELRAHACDICPKAGQWEAPDVPPQTRRYAQDEAMSNLGSANGSTVRPSPSHQPLHPSQGIRKYS